MHFFHQCRRFMSSEKKIVSGRSSTTASSCWSDRWIDSPLMPPWEIVLHAKLQSCMLLMTDSSITPLFSIYECDQRSLYNQRIIFQTMQNTLNNKQTSFHLNMRVNESWFLNKSWFWIKSWFLIWESTSPRYTDFHSSCLDHILSPDQIISGQGIEANAA